MPGVHLEEAFSDEVNPTDKLVAVLPLGATEGHGRHLAHGTDSLIPEEISRRLAATRDDCIVLPVMPYGMSWAYEGLGLSLSISSDTLTRFIVEVIESAHRQGINQFVIINGHDGNIPAIEAAARTIRLGHGLNIAALEAWWMALPSLVPEDTFPDWRGGHASMHETSLAMAASVRVDLDRAGPPRVDPDLTHQSPMVGVRLFAHARDSHPDGEFLDASRATRQAGEVSLDALVSHVDAFLNRAIEETWFFGGGL